MALPEYQRQGAGSIAQLTTDAEQITDLRTFASQRHTNRHATENAQGQTQRATGGIAADQANRAVLRHQIQAAGEGLQPSWLSTG